MTNFNAATSINVLVGNQNNAGWEAIDNQMQIIASEWKELSEGVENRDLEELRDGICDMLFTVYGLGHRAGMPVDADFKEVADSQFTKFDTAEESAYLTRKKYMDKGMAVHQVDRIHNDKTVIVTYSSADQTDSDGRFAPKGKWLKSHQFQGPCFQTLPNDVQMTLAL
jgi:NTP pyrophosphatase (non-canonical NTP hydrolase)